MSVFMLLTPASTPGRWSSTTRLETRTKESTSWANLRVIETQQGEMKVTTREVPGPPPGDMQRGTVLIVRERDLK
jgi:hypothetical protein